MRTKLCSISRLIANLLFIVLFLSASPGLAQQPAMSSAAASDLIFAWAKTWNHKVGPIAPGIDALDVGIGIVAAPGGVEVYGYAEAANPYDYTLDATPFITHFAPDGTQIGEGLLTFLSGRLDGVAEASDLRYLWGHGGKYQWLTSYSQASYGLPLDIAINNWVGAGEEVLSLTAYGSQAYVLTDRFFITRWNGDGFIQKWTHEIHLQKYEEAISGGWGTVAQVWDKVLTPEVSGILASDDTGLYILGGPVSDYDINAPPDDTAPKSITKFNFDGTLIWNQPLGQNTSTNQFGYTSLAIESGGFYLAGVTRTINPDKSQGPSDILVTKLNTAGEVVWSKSYYADAQGLSKWDPVIDMGTTGIYVAADLTTTNAYPYDTDLVILKLGFDGSQLATARWGQDKDEYTHDAVVVGDALYITGYTLSGNPPGGGDAFLVKYLGSDTSAPKASPTQSPNANGAGWNNTDVTVTWHWSDEDGGSGIDSADCTTSSTSTGEGSIALSATCRDIAGNIGMASYTVMVDKTSPVLAPVVSPASILLGGTATATSGATDDMSGVATESCGAIDTSSVGAKTVTCTATDNAGNTTIMSIAYRVDFAFSGFLSPVDSPPLLNIGKSGRTYPIKFELRDANGGYVGILSAVTSVNYKATSCTAFAVEEGDALDVTASGPAGLRYDLDANQYIYNWATPRAGCYTLFLTLDSGQIFQAYFIFSN